MLERHGCSAGLRAQAMEPSGVSLPGMAARSRLDPALLRWEVDEHGGSETRWVRTGGRGRQLSLPAQIPLIAALLKYFRSVTLAWLLQARRQAPAGSPGCGYKCSLLLPPQGK